MFGLDVLISQDYHSRGVCQDYFWEISVTIQMQSIGSDSLF